MPARKVTKDQHDAAQRALMAPLLAAAPWITRAAGNGSGRVVEMRMDGPSALVLRTVDGDETRVSVGANGVRWSPQKREDAEARLGVWPGYADAVEDFLGAVWSVQEQVADQAQEKAAATRAAARARDLDEWQYHNPPVCLLVPKQLADIPGIKSGTQSVPCHVYFLIRNGVVVYVGLTSQPWPTRLRTHLVEGEKEFDDVWRLEVDPSLAREIEAKYILAFRPRYNRTGLTGDCYAAEGEGMAP